MTENPEPAETGKEPTRYMVLWGSVPEDKADPMRWTEVGFYTAGSAAAAANLGRDDTESGTYAQMFDAAKKGTIKIRAIAQRSWPDDVEPQAIVMQPGWAVAPRPI
jgi:hypothetical protein